MLALRSGGVPDAAQEPDADPDLGAGLSHRWSSDVNMPWFLPLGALIGIAGCRTSMRARHSAAPGSGATGWVILVALSWFPLLCWFLAQVITQG